MNPNEIRELFEIALTWTDDEDRARGMVEAYLRGYLTRENER